MRCGESSWVRWLSQGQDSKGWILRSAGQLIFQVSLGTSPQSQGLLSLCNCPHPQTGQGLCRGIGFTLHTSLSLSLIPPQGPSGGGWHLLFKARQFCHPPFQSPDCSQQHYLSSQTPSVPGNFTVSFTVYIALLQA